MRRLLTLLESGGDPAAGEERLDELAPVAALRGWWHGRKARGQVLDAWAYWKARFRRTGDADDLKEFLQSTGIRLPEDEIDSVVDSVVTMSGVVVSNHDALEVFNKLMDNDQRKSAQAKRKAAGTAGPATPAPSPTPAPAAGSATPPPPAAGPAHGGLPAWNPQTMADVLDALHRDGSLPPDVLDELEQRLKGVS